MDLIGPNSENNWSKNNDNNDNYENIDKNDDEDIDNTYNYDDEYNNDIEISRETRTTNPGREGREIEKRSNSRIIGAFGIETLDFIFI